jgi:transcription initiation factor TFIIF subunit alpha
MSASPASSPQKGGGGGGGDQEFRVRIPTRNDKRTFHVMKFNASLKMDPSKWGQVRMVRENNKKDHKSWGADEDEPKFGAGSEFGRQEREEARRRKFGGKARKYNPEAQPWLMRLGSKRDGKTYKGSREGGVTENTTYYVFTHAADGSFEAHPVKEW